MNSSGIRSSRKRKLCAVPAAALLITASLLLGGCGSPLESQIAADEDGSIQMGSSLHVSAAPEPLSLYDSKDALAADGLYYACWTAGTSTEYENEDGDTVDLFPAQVTLLCSEKKDALSAENDLEGWQTAALDDYAVSDTRTEEIGGQEYEIITYTMKNPDSPWEGGVSAFTTHENAAVCTEITYQASFEGDPDRILLDLLRCYNYL